MSGAMIERAAERAGRFGDGGGGWSADEDAILRRVAAEGSEASAAVAALAVELGRIRSRNAVIGRGHRIGVRFKGRSGGARIGGGRKPAPKPACKIAAPKTVAPKTVAAKASAAKTSAPGAPAIENAEGARASAGAPALRPEDRAAGGTRLSAVAVAAVVCHAAVRSSEAARRQAFRSLPVVPGATAAARAKAVEAMVADGTVAKAPRSLFDPTLTTQCCRFPVDGTGADLIVCADPVVAPLPYCGPHARVCYEPRAAS